MKRKISSVFLSLTISLLALNAQWTSPVKIWPYSLAYFQPNSAHSLCADTLGNVHISWYDASKDAYGCIKKTKYDGIEWLYSGSYLDDPAGGTGYYQLSWMPTMSVEPDGKCLVAWEDYRTGSFELYAKYFNNSLWSSQLTVTKSFDSYSWFPKLKYAGGSHHLAYMDDSTGFFNIYYNYYDTLFHENVNVTNQSRNCINHDIFAYNDGEVSIVFTADTNGNQALYNVRKTTTGWSMITKIAALNASVYYPNIISDGADEYALFTSKVSGVSDLYISKYNGASWLSYKILTDGKSNIYNPAGILIGGKIRAVYVSDESGYGDLYTILYNPSTNTVEERTLIASHLHGFVMMPQIEKDKNGNIHVVYIVNDDTRVDSLQTNDIWWTMLPHTKNLVSKTEKPYESSMTYKGYMLRFKDENEYKITLINQTGRIVLKKSGAEKEFLIDKTNFKANGVFFVLVESEKTRFSEKIVWVR